MRFTGNRPFAAELNDYLESAGRLDSKQITHIFVVAWRSKVAAYLGKDAAGRDRRAYSVRAIATIPGDFAGAFGFSAGDRHATRVAKAIALKMLKNSPSQWNSWEEIVSAFNWLELIDVATKMVFGKSHVLQPRKGI